ncbi:ABC transporter ATP-binding protein [Limnoglobus roseus]|uniref:ABC transporter ATP-binding protein n=1 Tax=Limnoglobus roseus TaxID=2598579 RepID=A0A5C1AF32_9BACT|nr:ABC transporter ATP-binding protein [Limnoglobus roseus]QEL16576.1 ABC transporter ATP-binding protein [Limnoglobus roseus]
MPLPVAIRLENVCAKYAAVRAVEGVSLSVHRGEIVGLIGPNGSGKSTTLRLAAGLLDPVAGTVEVDGLARESDPLRYARRVGYVPQDADLYDELTAEQNLEFFARLYGLRGFELDAGVYRGLARAKLVDRANDRVRTFSGGMRQRLSIAVALLHDPAVLLLDEPTAALDPASRDALFADLHKLRDEGHAILLTTHHLDEAESGCDRIALLERGRLVAEGSPGELMRTKSSGRPVLFGHLSEPLAKFVERRARLRLGPGVELEITGRRVRLSAWGSDDLGRALAVLLSEGAKLDAFRTPAGRLETNAKAA